MKLLSSLFFYLSQLYLFTYVKDTLTRVHTSRAHCVITLIEMEIQENTLCYCFFLRILKFELIRNV